MRETFQEVDTLKFNLDAYRPLSSQVVANLRDQLNLAWTYNSNAIEGNTLSLIETKVVLEEGITVGGKSLREHLEAINHREAIYFVESLVSKSESAKLSEVNIRQIHALVLKGIDDSMAGRYRTSGVRIVGANHIPPNSLRVKDEMENLIGWYFGAAQNLHPVERAAQLHTLFVKIHPFVDGNGRTARLLLNLELMRNGYPIAIIRKEDRKQYYEALDKACAQENHHDFTVMVADCVTKSFKMYFEVLEIQPDSSSSPDFSP